MIDKEYKRKVRLYFNEFGDYLVRPTNGVENLERICEIMGIASQDVENFMGRKVKQANVTIDNFSLYELNKSNIPLADYSKDTDHQGRHLFVHMPLNKRVNLTADNGLQANLPFNWAMKVNITSWKKMGIDKMLSLFGIAQVKSYGLTSSEEVFFDIYHPEKMEQCKRDLLIGKPIYGISLHVKPSNEEAGK